MDVCVWGGELAACAAPRGQSSKQATHKQCNATTHMHTHAHTRTNHTHAHAHAHTTHAHTRTRTHTHTNHTHTRARIQHARTHTHTRTAGDGDFADDFEPLPCHEFFDETDCTGANEGRCKWAPGSVPSSWWWW